MPYTTCGVWLPPSGIEPVPPALGTWSLNHWTAREVPTFAFCLFLVTFIILFLCFAECLKYTAMDKEDRGFPGGSDGKESSCSGRDPGSIPGSGRSPGEGNGYPLQYSCLENPMIRETWRATVHRVAESDMTESPTLSLFHKEDKSHLWLHYSEIITQPFGVYPSRPLFFLCIFVCLFV